MNEIIAGSIFKLSTTDILYCICIHKNVAIASAVLLLKAAQGKIWRYLDGVAPPPAKKKNSDNSEK